MSMHVPANAKAAAISVVVRRADGTVQNLGVVSHYHRNPVRRALLSLRRRLGLRVSEQQVYG